MSNTSMKLGAWWRGKWPEYISVSHDGAREEGRKYVPERTCRMEYDRVHCDYACTACGERYESDMYASVAGDDRILIKQMRYCTHCGARVEEE